MIVVVIATQEFVGHALFQVNAEPIIAMNKLVNNALMINNVAHLHNAILEIVLKNQRRQVSHGGVM